jgi:hypothetical protein
LEKQAERMHGGFSRWSSSLDFQPLLCIPLGQHFKVLIITSMAEVHHIYRHFIHPLFLGVRDMRGLDQSQICGQHGYHFRQRFSFFGHLVVSALRAITTEARTTKHFGLTQQTVP